MRTTELVYGLSSQTVEFYPPDYELVDGVPSSATASIFRGSQSLDDTAVESPTVTVDAVSTTVDVASGYAQANRKKLNLAATTSISIGRRYLLENVDTQREVVMPTRVVSADYVELENDLVYDYAVTSSTFKGIRLTLTAGSWVTTESNINHPGSRDDYPVIQTGGSRTLPYKVIWTYTVNSIVRRGYSYLWLVRQLSKHNVSHRDLMERWASICQDEDREVRGRKFAYAIDAAWDIYRADLLASGYHASQVRDTEIVDESVRRGALLVLGRAGKAPEGRDVEQFIAESKKDYESLFAKTISTLHVDIDVSTEGAASADPVQQPFFGR